MLLNNLFEALARTGQGKTAVVGWGRGMGHKGHMLLAKAVIHHAQQQNAKPFFVVSRTSLVDPATGQPWTDKPTFTKTKDDPLSPEEKLATYRKVFPQNAEVFSVATADASTLDKVLAKIAGEGFSKVILIVGELEKASFSFLIRPDKSGIPPYQRAGLQDLEIISRQDTTEPSSVKGSPEYQEGPRATPLRQVLLDPSKSEEEQFAIWRRDMPDNLSDEEVKDLMLKAKQRMSMVPAAKNKKQGVLEGPNDGKEDNFTIDDIKRLEKIRDLETLKAQAKELIKGKPVRRMKPEKISWFYNHIDTLKNPLAVIKMMYDLMLAGEGNKVIGSRNSMSSNSYRTRFGEQGVAEAELDEACWKDYKQIGMKKKGGKQVPNCVPKESMLPASSFAGTPKNKLGPSAHLKGSMKRPARAGDLVGGVEEGLGSKLAGLGLAGAMAFGAGGANARVSGDQDPSINRLTGKPNVTQNVPTNIKPAATTPAGFNKEYLQSVIDGKHPRPLISKEKAADILMKMNAVDEAKIKGADGKACWKGYKYAGTKNGKDKCVPIGEAYETEMSKAIALLEGINLKPSDVHNIADKKGIPWDNDRKFLNLSKKLTGKSHLDKMSSDELRIVYNYIRKIR